MVMMTLENVAITRNGRTLFRELSMSIEPGQWWMVCGPNGVGKTSLIHAISGQVDYQGKMTYKGQDLRRLSSKERAKEIAFLSQNQNLDLDYSLEELVSLGRYAHQKGWLKYLSAQDRAVIERVLRQIGLQAKANHPLKTLSGGEVQRALLAQVLAQEPNLLILDEPTNHLDLVYEESLFEFLESWLFEEGHAIISVVHDLSLATRYGSHILLIDPKGRSLEGSKELVLTPDNLDLYYQMDVVAYMRDKNRYWYQ